MVYIYDFELAYQTSGSENNKHNGLAHENQCRKRDLKRGIVSPIISQNGPIPHENLPILLAIERVLFGVRTSGGVFDLGWRF
jgi:hypothetical protein